ncbi:MAG: response regulator [Actinomycetota bacterium]
MDERNGRVELLVVEDDPNDLELIMRALKRHNLGNNVRHVGDGQEALDILLGERRSEIHGPPRVVLLDLKLPKVDGLTVLRALRGDPRTRFLPIVVLTSSQEERDLVDSYELGVNSFIVKPLNFDEFVRVVGEIGLYWVLFNRAPDVEP